MQVGMTDYEVEIAPVKKRLLSSIPGGSRVLEIGIGTAPSLQFYPKNVKLIGIDPNPVMLEYAEKNAKAQGRELLVAEGSALSLPFGDQSMVRIGWHCRVAGIVKKKPYLRISSLDLFSSLRNSFFPPPFSPVFLFTT